MSLPSPTRILPSLTLLLLIFNFLTHLSAASQDPDTISTLQLLHQYQAQQDQQFSPTSFNDHAPLFNPECFRASHYQSQYNAQLIHYLKKNTRPNNHKKLDDFLEWKGYDFRADGCNLTMILREVDAINDNYSRILATVGSLLERSLSMRNLKVGLWLMARVGALLLGLKALSFMLPARFNTHSVALIILGFVFAFVGTFIASDLALSFIGYLSVAHGVTCRKSRPLLIKLIASAASFLCMCSAIQLESQLLGWTFIVSVHGFMTYLCYLFWKRENLRWFAAGNILSFVLFTSNLLQYVFIAQQLKEGDDGHQDDTLLAHVFLEAWKWCAVISFTVYWTFSLFPARQLFQKEWKYLSLVNFAQSVSTMIAISLLLLYGRYVSFTFNIFQAAALVLACSLVVFVRKNMTLSETICVALYVGLVGYAIFVQAKYYEFELVLALTR